MPGRGRANAGGYGHIVANLHTCAQGYADTCAHAYAVAHVHADTCAHAYGYTHADTCAHAYTHASPYSHTGPIAIYRVGDRRQSVKGNPSERYAGRPANARLQGIAWDAPDQR